MTMIIDLRWQDYEIENETPRKDDQGNPELDEEGNPIIDRILSGIKMKIKPLNYECNQTMLAFVQKNKSFSDKLTKEEEEQQTAKMVSDIEFPKILQLLLPQHVKDLEGVEVIDEATEEQRPAVIEDIVAYGAFMYIALSIFSRLSVISNLSEGAKDGLKKK